jgi:hypothetical protein
LNVITFNIKAVAAKRMAEFDGVTPPQRAATEKVTLSEVMVQK